MRESVYAAQVRIPTAWRPAATNELKLEVAGHINNQFALTRFWSERNPTILSEICILGLLGLVRLGLHFDRDILQDNREFSCGER